MAVYRRTSDGPWWVRFRAGRQYIRRSSGTTDRKKAEEFEQALRDRYWRQAKLGEQVHTWREAVDRYKREAQWRKNTRLANEHAFTFFERISHIPVAAINKDVVTAAREYVQRSQGISSAPAGSICRRKRAMPTGPSAFTSASIPAHRNSGSVVCQSADWRSCPLRPEFVDARAIGPKTPCSHHR
jgi:hypothetical protein